MVKARLNTTYLTDKIHYQEMLTGANGSDLKIRGCNLKSLLFLTCTLYTVQLTAVSVSGICQNIFCLFAGMEYAFGTYICVLRN